MHRLLPISRYVFGREIWHRCRPLQETVLDVGEEYVLLSFYISSFVQRVLKLILILKRFNFLLIFLQWKQFMRRIYWIDWTFSTTLNTVDLGTILINIFELLLKLFNLGEEFDGVHFAIYFLVSLVLLALTSPDTNRFVRPVASVQLYWRGAWCLLNDLLITIQVYQKMVRSGILAIFIQNDATLSHSDQVLRRCRIWVLSIDA